MPAGGGAALRAEAFRDFREAGDVAETSRARNSIAAQEFGSDWTDPVDVRSAALAGIDALEITVEVHVALGLPQVTVVGLAAGAVKEARERVVAAPGLSRDSYEIASKSLA